MIDLHLPPLEPRPDGYTGWWPLNAEQQAALRSRAELLLYGGASGGGKTQLAVMDAAEERWNPALRALVIRRQRTDMGELKDLMHRLYKPMGARHDRGEHAWVFPAGGTVRYGYLKTDAHLENYQGNPFSCLELDESGQHPEHRIRALIAWLAADERAGLRVRARFTCNPGGEGYGWEMQVFLRNRCPIHYPAPPDDSLPRETSALPGRVYGGATWTTGEPVGFSTSFIPAFIQNNPTYYRAKIKGLQSQAAVLRKQLLDGCWCNAEGIYFDFMQPGMVVPVQSIGEQWWWNRFISIDYGFGNSSAAAGMYAISPLGRVYKTRERDEPKMPLHQFCERLCKTGFDATERAPKQAAWLTKLKDGDPERPKVLYAVVDSANDHHDGVGKSQYEMIAEIFAKYNIPCIKCGGESKDSQASAQNLYNGMATMQMVLTSGCPRTYKSLSSRVIDERMAIKKRHGDPLDDVLDETRYGYNTWIEQSEMPRRVALEDEMEKLRQKGLDETSLAHYRWKKERDLETAERRQGLGMPLTGSGLLDGTIRR
jgi:hypothetical protein